MPLPPPRLHWLPSPSRKTLTLILLFSLLFIFSYTLGLYSSSNSLPSLPSPPPSPCLTTTTAAAATLNFLPLHTADAILPTISQPLPPLLFCPSNFTDYSPCHDPNRERFFSTRDFQHRERHCPNSDEKPRCRVPRPEGYRRPVAWPESRGRVWFANVPSKKLIEAKKDQNWVVMEGEWLVFPGGGTSFPHGVKQYVDGMGKLVPLRTGEIRTVLDIGCGVISNFLLLFGNF